MNATTYEIWNAGTGARPWRVTGPSGYWRNAYYETRAAAKCAAEAERNFWQTAHRINNR